MKVTAIQAKFKHDDIILTSMGASPRGTRVRLKTVVAKKDLESLTKTESNVLAAIEQLLSKAAPE